MIPWMEWGAEAFERARAEGRPVLLSLHAAWCHACHRMDEETWDDPGVAAAVARAVVPVRADADARPDVYARYHLGGLPTTALLDADGRFVRGATFLTRPALFAFLDRALADHAAGRIAQPRATAAPAPRPADGAPPEGAPARAAPLPAGTPAGETRPAGTPPAGDLTTETVAWLLRRADAEHGGFGWAPKLPEPEALTLLLRYWRAGRDPAVERAVRAALDAIARNLIDPRDGGFFRYAAAADWSAPHTEKVTVEQARLTRLFLEAGVALGQPRYIAAGARALGHARQRLVDAERRVLASVAADPDYYAERDADADPDGRDAPDVDRRRFADAGAQLTSAAWLAFAVTGAPPEVAAEFIDAAPDGLIPHRLDQAGGPVGLLADQAAALDAAVLRYSLTGDEWTLVWARRVADQSIALLWDDGEGAFRGAPVDPAVALPPMYPIVANAEMGLALTALAGVTAGRYRRHAERMVATLAPRARAAAPALALVAQRLASPPARVEIEGPPGDPRATALARVAVAALGPQTVVDWTVSDETSAAVCAGELCLPPIQDPAELADALAAASLVPRGILLA